MSSEAARQLGQAPSGLVASSQADNDKYAEAVRYIFSNADFTSAAKRYQLPQENWTRFEALLTRLLTEAGSAEMTISTVDAFQVDA